MSLKANKQKMKYSRSGQKITIYETDDDGNRKFYETSDGEKIYYTKKWMDFQIRYRLWRILAISCQRFLSKSLVLMIAHLIVRSRQTRVICQLSPVIIFGKI